MKTSFLPRPAKMIKPAPETDFVAQTAPVTRTQMPWDTEPDAPSESRYTAFPQAPEATGLLAQDLEPFYRTK